MKILTILTHHIMRLDKFLFCGALLAVGCTSRAPETVEITYADMADKVRGAWAGKMIGVMYGRPMEFQVTDRMYTEPVAWEPENVEAALREDDIYGQMNFMATMQRLGQTAPLDSLARYFAEAEFDLCHANLQARKNYFDGLRGLDISTPANNIHCEDIDFQIECDFIGFVNPAMPRSAAAMCDRVGRVMAAADGLYAGIYISTLHSLSYVSDDIRQVVDEALNSIPADCAYALCIKDVIAAYEADSTDWTKCWVALNEKWNENDVCTPYNPFNIDAKLNGAYVVMGLLYGQGDLKKTMDITVGCGQDTDCNTATAAAVLCLMSGYEAIPDIFKSYIPAIADEKFIYTDYSLNDAVDVSLSFIAENVVAGGGKYYTDSLFSIVPQTPVPAPAEPGLADLRLRDQTEVTDTSRWHFSGNWQPFVYGAGDDAPYLMATAPGDSLTLEFEGTGIALLGSWNTDGGRAEVTVDDMAPRTVNTYFVKEAGKFEGNRAYIFYTTDLPDGQHTLTLRVLPDSDPKSTGHKIYLQRALIYGTSASAQQ